MISITCRAPSNIAVIKYWGKRDDQLILPMNNSISGTISLDQMCAKTTVSACETFTETKLWLNGVQLNLSGPNSRYITVINKVKNLALDMGVSTEIVFQNLHICSENNFPTAAGLASSAAGYACLVYAIASLYGIEMAELSTISRVGSGSACRSMYGGFVEWQRGRFEDGCDSRAVQICNELYWPEMRVLIIVVNDQSKKIGSTNAMKRSVLTSQLLKYRCEQLMDDRVKAMKQAILDKDFETFAHITMSDSNQFHAMCQDTYPPCTYMNDVSHRIVEMVHLYNYVMGETKLAYTFDAGPNAVLYCLNDQLPKVLHLLHVLFPNDLGTSSEYLRGIPITLNISNPIDPLIASSMAANEKNLFKYIVCTQLGGGPEKLPDTESLLNEMGIPKNLQSTDDISRPTKVSDTVNKPTTTLFISRSKRSNIKDNTLTVEKKLMNRLLKATTNRTETLHVDAKLLYTMDKIVADEERVEATNFIQNSIVGENGKLQLNVPITVIDDLIHKSDSG